MLNIIQNCEIKYTIGEVTNDFQATHNADITRFIQALLNVTTFEEMHKICGNIRYHYGFDYFTLITRFQRLNKKPFCFITREHDTKWAQHYEENKYLFTDPSIRIGMIRTTPFIWSNHECKKLIKTLHPSEVNIVSDALDFGLKDIFHIPFHGANGSYGLIKFVNHTQGQSSHTQWERHQHKISELFLLASFIYEALEKIINNNESHNILSQREKDVMLMTAQGNNPAHIADTLHISTHTVCNHLRNVRTKLQVKNTTHAVAKTISTRLITF